MSQREMHLPASGIEVPPGPFQPTWESLERHSFPSWYLDAKFGNFIHRS